MLRLLVICFLAMPLVACRGGDKPTAPDTTAKGTTAATTAVAAPKPGETLRVAAAADLAFAFEEMGKAFVRQGGSRPVFSFGSTGLLAKQIQEGAPFDVFAAANVSFADAVVDAGVCDGATKALYGQGRIVFWTTKDHVPVPKDLKELTDKRFSKVAIANPEHAPYGKAAQQALETVGLWDQIKPKLVFGENVQQTLQFGVTGNADAAIVALSLAKVTEGGQYFVIDETLHKPINQALVVCKQGKAQAQGMAFARFVASPEGRDIMKRFGFVLPAETGTATPSTLPTPTPAPTAPSPPSPPPPAP